MALTDKPKRLWRRLFRKDDYFGEIVERAVEAQKAFENQHPVPYSVQQRTLALAQRAARLHGSAVPAPLATLILEAAGDWERVSKAAEEEP